MSFSISSGAGSNTAKFDGGAWALREDMTYAAYYPYSSENTSYSEIRLSYEGQQQAGSASLAHLGTHDFMATSATSAENGELNFAFKHLNSVAQLRLTVPVAATFTTLSLRCDEEELFTKVATLNLSGGEYAYAASETTNQLGMTLSEVSSTEANQELVFYMNVPPTDMTGKIVYVVLRSADNKVYQAQLAT